MHLKIVPAPLCEPAMGWLLTQVVHEIQDGRPPRDRSFLFLRWLVPVFSRGE